MSSTNRNILASLYIGILIIVLLTGCSTLGKTDRSTQYTIAYQAMGAVLEVAKPQILAMCADSVFDEADCSKAKKAYNQAVTSYKLLGDAVDSLILTEGDDRNVQRLLLQLQALLVVVNQFLAT